jgi:hypothetical protein
LGGEVGTGSGIRVAWSFFVRAVFTARREDFATGDGEDALAVTEGYLPSSREVLTVRIPVIFYMALLWIGNFRGLRSISK